MMRCPLPTLRGRFKNISGLFFNILKQNLVCCMFKDDVLRKNIKYSSLQQSFGTHKKQLDTTQDSQRITFQDDYLANSPSNICISIFNL